LKKGRMDEWNDGRVEGWKIGQFDNSMIRQLEEWKDGRMEEWNETYQVCKTCEVLKDTYL